MSKIVDYTDLSLGGIYVVQTNVIGKYSRCGVTESNDCNEVKFRIVLMKGNKLGEQCLRCERIHDLSLISGETFESAETIVVTI